jgi:hypothetical protein
MRPTAAARRGDGPLDERGQLIGRLDRRSLALRDDGPGDAPRKGLLTIRPQDARKFALVEITEEVRGRATATGVEAQVERPAGAEAEAPVVIGELEGAQSEVEEDAVDGLEAGGRGDLVELFEVRLSKRYPLAERRQADLASGDGRLIGIQSEQAAIRRIRLQDPDGVPSTAERGIDLELARERRESHQDLLHHHGPVPYVQCCHADVGSVRILKTRVVR